MRRLDGVLRLDVTGRGPGDVAEELHAAVREREA
jgi:hypothetical protein